MRRLAWITVLVLVPAAAAAGESALVSFEAIKVPPVGRGEANELIDAGVLDVEGYREMVLSLAGELEKASVPGGSIGVLLLPDGASFDFVRRHERLYPFPVEAAAAIPPGARPVFVGEQVVARVAFPRYRVLLYNATDRTATVSLYVYRSH